MKYKQEQLNDLLSSYDELGIAIEFLSNNSINNQEQDDIIYQLKEYHQHIWNAICILQFYY